MYSPPSGPSQAVTSFVPTGRESIPAALGLMVLYAVCYNSLTYLPLWTGAMTAPLGLRASQVGMIGSVELATVALASVARATLAKDSLGRGAVATLLLIYIAASLASAALPPLAPFILARMVVGACSGVMLADIFRRAGTWRTPAQIFAGQIFFMVVSAVAFFSMTPVLLPVLGPGAAFYMSGLWAAIALVLSPWLTASGDGMPPHDASGAPAAAANLSVRIASLCAPGLLLLAANSVWAYVAPAAAAVGMPLVKLSHLLAVGALVNLAAPVLSGYASRDRLRPGIAIIASFALFLAASLCITIAGKPLLFTGGVLTQMFFVMFMVPFLLRQMIVADPTGRLVGMSGASMMIGSSLGPLLGGQIIDRFGFDGLAVATVIVTLVAFICALASLLPKGSVFTRDGETSSARNEVDGIAKAHRTRNSR